MTMAFLTATQRRIDAHAWSPAIQFRAGAAVPMLIVSAIFVAYTSVAHHTAPLWIGVAAVSGAVGACISLIVHELGHVHAARRIDGVRVRKVVMMSLGAATHLDGAYRSGRDQIRVAAAGPLASLMFAASLFVCLALPLPVEVRWAIFLLCFLNLGVALVALLPLHPFDGHKMLVGMLWIVVRSESRARLIIRRAGMVMVTADLAVTSILLVERPLIGCAVLVLGVGLLGERRLAKRYRRRSA